ncbi:MAG: sulfur carrier protein ThiS [Lachnospiraceae bacterium]|nr:sulfur carrier protein ThiS [Lachnospiraceae bacterium]
MIFVNGKELALDAPVTVAEYLEKNRYQSNRIAVELNSHILPKADYASTMLQDGDKLEIVSFVGGG